MLANLFRKTNLTTMVLGFVMVFIVLFFFHAELYHILGTSMKFFTVLLETVLLMALMGILYRIKKKDRYFVVPPILFLMAPLVLFLAPRQSFQIEGLVLSLFLALAFQEVVMMEQRSQILKPLFNISFLLCLIAYIEPLLSPLFLIIIGVLIQKKQLNIKGITAVITPVLAFSFLFLSLGFFWELENIQLWKLSLRERRSFLGVEELIFLGFIFFITALLLFSKANQSTFSSSLKNLFHLVTLVLGLGIAVSPIESQFNFYEIIFFSTLYLAGIALYSLSNFKVNIILYLLIALKTAALILIN